MSDFQSELRKEILSVEARIKELHGAVAELERLQKLIVKLEMLSDAYGAADHQSTQDAHDAELDDEPQDLPSLAEAKEAVVEQTVADNEPPAAPAPYVPSGPPVGAKPDVLAPRPKAVPPAPARLQKQQVLCEGDGIQACWFPNQVRGPRGAPVDVTELQAAIIAVLLSVTPNILADKQIADRAYGMAKRRTTSGSTAMIGYELRDLTNKLAPAGVKITHTKGIGYSIAAAS